ncbi:CHAT domain-containing protein [Leptothoe spongobia]|uniref:CHAT domain-containing protein n=1 Tax=Leptothoe spongobia TAU-MAC 1115 TaxID=1967444 RepID=A0A947GHZ2_9CYAN|nr:CHAT domain-containing protein [Leptothoe spongobia]MBT9314908.1 CHAT domain-containing protein [Leptothoe spongobia TAU-MAC 1115]
MNRQLRYALLLVLTCCFVIMGKVSTAAVEPSFGQPFEPLLLSQVSRNLSPRPSVSGMASIALPVNSPHDSGDNSPTNLLAQGQQYYHAGQLHQAIHRWHQAIATATASADQALAYTYLTLAYQDLGQWSAAADAIAQAHAHVPNQPAAVAQVLNAQGNLEFHQGHPAQALATWQTAEQNYRQAHDPAGVMLTQTNQIQALRSLGYYSRASRLIDDIRRTLADQPVSLLKAQGLQSIGIILRTTGELTEAEAVLTDSLAIAQELEDGGAIANARFQLGNTFHAQGDLKTAFIFYQQVLNTNPAQSRLWLETALNQLRLLFEQSQEQTAVVLANGIQAQLETLPPSRWGVYAQVNFAETLLTNSKLKIENSKLTGSPPLSVTPSPPLPLSLAHLLAQAVRQAQTLNDPRAESYALGQLAKLYEQTQQWSEALALTEQAIVRSQQVQADEITAAWQWQQGRLLKAQGQIGQAIDAYGQAVTLLESLDQDLVASNPDIQFSFQRQVEPVYREFVQLLLQDVDDLSPEQQQQRLAQSRQVIEALQLAELENFFREACLTYTARPIDQIDPQAAVLYPILLDDRLEVILALPNGTLQHYGNSLSPQARQKTFQQLRQALNPAFPANRVLPPAQHLYDWLLRPAEPALAESGVQRLVFVLDGYLRNLPMAVLHDGNQFLLERYSLALTPGLQLFESPGVPDQGFEVLAGGMSVAHQGFNALPAVDVEIQQIQAQASTQVLLNQEFTKDKLAQEVVERPISIVHLATHGQFSSKADETFILTWNNRLQIKELERLLKQRELKSPIEILILSACQTAKGDDSAALGMAGVAVRSGARSTVASLWSVEDFSTAALMKRFYQQLGSLEPTRAEALQQAQLSLLRSEDYAHPYYWAPFVLIGNWL